MRPLKDSRIMFKCEDSLWQMLRSGEKTWDARRWDMADDRIYALSQLDVAFSPLVWSINFLNKATGEILTLRYLGVEFSDWAPGWCFLKLGACLAPYVAQEDDGEID